MKLEAKNLLDALSEKGINYKLFEHEAFFTVEESSKLKNDLDMHGAHTKNLFLRDKKRNFFLLSCLDNQEVDLKEIKNVIACQGNLSFGSHDYLYEKWRIPFGSASIDNLNQHDRVILHDAEGDSPVIGLSSSNSSFDRATDPGDGTMNWVVS